MTQPVRTCIGCRARHTTDQLTRYAYRDGRVVLGPTLLGRGAWLCSGSADCLAAAVRRKAFHRALRREFSSDQLPN